MTDPHFSSSAESAVARITKFATSTEMQASVDAECAKYPDAAQWHASAELADFRSHYDECIKIARATVIPDGAQPVPTAWRYKVSPNQLNWCYDENYPRNPDVYNVTALYESQAKEPEANETGPRCGSGSQGSSRSVDGRASTATSELMDVTAGETAPHFQLSAATEEYQRCMDMLGDVPGVTLEDRLTHFIGSHMALQIKAADEPQTSGTAAYWKERHDTVLQKHIECCGQVDAATRQALEKARSFIELELAYRGPDVAGHGLDALNTLDRALAVSRPTLGGENV